MTREQAKQNLISFGIEEPTDENITNYLNTVNGEIKKEKDKAEKIKEELDNLKESATSAEELQRKIEEIEQSKLTETEKIAKELEKANQRVADLEKSAAIQNQRASAVEKFKVTAEQARQIIKDDGSFDQDVLGQIIADKESAAALAKEQEIAKLSTNPGGKGASSSDGNSIAKDIAVASAKRAGAANESILNNYRR